MGDRTLTVHVPSDLYERLKQSADASQRSVEEEALELVVAALASRTISSDLAEIVTSLPFLTDQELRQAAQSQLTVEQASELESLHWKRQREGLLPAEELRAVELENLFERFVFLRSQAAVLLKERGHTVEMRFPCTDR